MSFIDWALAERIAVVAAGESAERMDGADLGIAAARAHDAVTGYTGLDPEGGVPAAEWVSRQDWARINLSSLRAAIGPVEDRLLDGVSLPGPATRGIAAVAGRIAAVEAGAMIGFAARKVLGQYEFALLGPTRPPRLLFVGANLEQARVSLGARPEPLLHWVALHEVTHAVHFAAAPWLRDHLAELASELITGARLGIGPAEILGAARRVLSTDPRRLLAEIGASDPLTLLAPSASKPQLEAVQATMAAIEGYAEHVMDAAAGEMGDAVDVMRAGVEARRRNRGIGRLLSWLLGMELKMRQYRDGKLFADAVVRLGGIEALNRAWERAPLLPTLSELEAPADWLERTQREPVVV